MVSKTGETGESILNEKRDEGKATMPAFIRLAEPPLFDIQRHMQNIRNQLPPEQLKCLESALKADPDLFTQASKSDLILDCDAEESFTLETFGGLLKAARAAGKDFILARVTTLDPTGPKPHVYHSHYSAHQINKILFRTQPEEALLHRMKSRNPLNNMLIVGEVTYYVIRPQDVDAAFKRYERLLKQKNGEESQDSITNTTNNNNNDDNNLLDMPPENPNPIPSITTSLTDSLLFGLLQRKKMETEAALSSSAPASASASKASSDANQGSPHINVAPFANAADFTSPSMDSEAPLRLSRNASSASLTRSDSLSRLPTEGEPAVLYEAQVFATDDDFLIRPEVREYFKVNSVNPDDYLLFTLYRSSNAGMTEIPVTGFTSVEMPAGIVDAAGGARPARRVKSWKNCWGLFYAPSPSLSTLRTGFISREAFKYILALYIIACVLALIFLIPIQLSYFVGFGMFALIVFIAVFLVECNPSENASNRWNIFTYRQRMMEQREIADANANITSSHSVGQQQHQNTEV